jgi:hypothetical protein
MGLGFVVEFLWSVYPYDKLDVTNEGLLQNIQSRYLNYFFYLTYLVLPSISTMTFQLFVCKNVDPNNEDNDRYDSFLVADMRISCTSDYYKSWTWYGYLMILVYPVGTIVFYGICLYFHRKEIMEEGTRRLTEMKSSNLEETVDENNRDLKGNAPSTPTQLSSKLSTKVSFSRSRKVSCQPSSIKSKSGEMPEADQDDVSLKKARMARVQSMAFLWKSYYPQYWYWELIECIRRILLTAVLSICSTGSPDQYVFGIFLAFVFLKAYGYCKPYNEDDDMLMADIGQAQIFLTYFCALIISNNLLRARYLDVLGSLMIFVNLGVVFVGFYFEIIGHFSDQRTGFVKEVRRFVLKIISRLHLQHFASENVTALELMDAKENMATVGDELASNLPNDDHEFLHRHSSMKYSLSTKVSRTAVVVPIDSISHFQQDLAGDV